MKILDDNTNRHCTKLLASINILNLPNDSVKEVPLLPSFYRGKPYWVQEVSCPRPHSHAGQSPDLNLGCLSPEFMLFVTGAVSCLFPWYITLCGQKSWCKEDKTDRSTWSSLIGGVQLFYKQLHGLGKLSGKGQIVNIFSIVSHMVSLLNQQPQFANPWTKAWDKGSWNDQLWLMPAF